MFYSNQGKGFGITFPNGWTVSVQFGPGNYCENRDGSFQALMPGHIPAYTSSETAEIAAWNGDKWHKFDTDDVKGYCDSTEVLAFINMIAAKKA